MPLLDSERNFQPVIPFETSQDLADQSNIFARQQTAQENDFALEDIARVPAGVFLSIIDTFAESFGLLDDRELEEALTRHAPEFGEFFNENRDALGLAGDLIGLFIPATIATKAVRTTGTLGKLANKTLGPGSQKFFSTGKSNQKLFEGVTERAKIVATRRGRDFLSDPTFQSMRRKALGRSIADTAIETAAADGLIALSMRSSDFLFPSEMTLMDNLVFFGGANAVISLGAYGIARRTLRIQVQRGAGPVAMAAQNPGKIPLANAQGFPDNRGTAVTTQAAILEEVLQERKAAISAGEDEVIDATRKEQAAIEEQISLQLQRAFKDNPIPGVTNAIKLARISGEKNPEIKTALDFLANNPSGMTGLRSLESFDEGTGVLFEKALKSHLIESKTNIETLQKTVDDLEKQIDSKAFPPSRLVEKHERLQDELQGLSAKFQDDLGSSGVIIEIDNLVSSPHERNVIFQDGRREIEILPDGISGVKHEGFEAIVDPTGTFRFKKRGIKGEEVVQRELTKDDIITVPNTASETKAITALEVRLDNLKTLEKGALQEADEGRQLGDEGIIRFQTTRAGKFAKSRKLIEADLEKELDKQFKRKVEIERRARAKEGLDQGDDIFGGQFPQQFPNTLLSAGKLNLLERTAIYDGLQKTAERVNPRTFEGVTLSPDAHHTQIDFVLDLVERFGDEIMPKLGGITADDIAGLEYRSLAGKFKEFQLAKKAELDKMKTNKSFARAVASGREKLLSAHDLTRMFNLESAESPVIKFFTINQDNHKILPLSSFARNMEEFDGAMRSLVDALPEEADAAGRVYRGSMLNLSREKRPVLTVQRAIDPGIDAIGRDHLVQQTTAIRMGLINDLRESDSIIVKEMVDQIDGRPDQIQAFKDNMLQLLNGNEPSGKVMSLLVSQAFRNRDLPGFKAIDELTSVLQKASDQKIDGLLAGVKKNFSRILERSSKGDLVHFFTARTALGAGWDVNAQMIPMPGAVKGGQFGIELKNTDRNKQLWRSLHNEDMPEGQVFMPISGSKGDPVVVTTVGKNAIEGFNVLSQQLLKEVNALKKAKGLPEIAKKELHLPPKDLSGQHLVYLIDHGGKVVTVEGAATRQEAMRKALKERKIANRPLEVIDGETMERHFEARLQTFFSMDDLSKPSRQDAVAKGTSFGQEIEVSAKTFQGMIEQTTRHLKDIERETRTLIFEPELQFLKYQKAAGGLGGEVNTVYDRMINRIIGTQNLDASTIPGKVLTSAADIYDTMMQRIFDKVSPVMAEIPMRKVFAKKEFEQVQGSLDPQFQPFHDFNDFLEKTTDVRLPGELRKHAGALNEITTALTIRIFDVGMGVINMATLATTLPPVISMLRPTADELAGGAAGNAAWRDRIAAWGTATPAGVTQFSPTRAVISGIHFMFSKEGRELAKKAKKAGFFEQFAAEQVEIFARTGEKYVPGLLRNFAKKTSVITDQTEIMARQISFMTFLNIAKKGMKLEDKAAFTFAHAQANNVIADFRPSNRPVVFQGAAGMPLGLFTTFMWNYLQRVYSTVESAQIRSLVNQVGLQTMLFGAESLPGVPEFINTFTSNYDGSTNLVDRLHKSMGSANAEAFLNGSISTLTGISLGPRAAVGVPFSSGLGAQAVPGLRLAGRAVETAWKEIDSIVQNQGIDVGEMSTILAQSGLNKFTSNAIEVAQGFSTDRSGNIIEKDVRNEVGIRARLFGFKPLMADELRQENRRNRVTERKRANLKERLGATLQSQVRTGKLTQDSIDDALSKYVIAGGNAENFQRFFSSQIVKGTTDKLNLELVKALKANNDQNRMSRLLFLSGQGKDKHSFD